MNGKNHLEFVGLDFETANKDKGSICSVGAVFVNGGQISGYLSQHVRPTPMEIADWNRNQLGLSEEILEFAPRFPVVWETLRPLLLNRYVFAHSVRSAELVMLWKCMQLHELDLCEIEFVCTEEVARIAWPELVDGDGFGLKSVASFLEIDLANHHSAVDDAKACAQIVMKAARHLGVKSAVELVSQLGVTVHCLNDYGGPRTEDWDFEYTKYESEVGGRADSLGFGAIDRPDVSPTKDWRRERSKRRTTDYEPTVEIHPGLVLFEKNVVVTGFSRDEEEEVQQLVTNLGGNLKSSVSGKTDYLICGENPGPKKLEKMMGFIENGKGGEILSEAEFMAMVPENFGDC